MRIDKAKSIHSFLKNPTFSIHSILSLVYYDTSRRRFVGVAGICVT